MTALFLVYLIAAPFWACVSIVLNINGLPGADFALASAGFCLFVALLFAFQKEPSNASH